MDMDIVSSPSVDNDTMMSSITNAKEGVPEIVLEIEALITSLNAKIGAMKAEHRSSRVQDFKSETEYNIIMQSLQNRINETDEAVKKLGEEKLVVRHLTS